MYKKAMSQSSSSLSVFLHMLYHLKLGGVPLKQQKPVLICLYSEEESAVQIILRSFEIFLKKELQNVAKQPYSNV